MQQRRNVVHALILLSLPKAYAADRKFTIKNSCSFSIWPAVSNFLQEGSSLYGGESGWEAKPGTSRDVTIPSEWNGRVWPRRECKDEGGKFVCTVGGVPGGLNPANNELGNANVAEFNLHNGYQDLDFWDISAVPGFAVPMSVTPTESTCASSACTVDLTLTCPPELAVHSVDRPGEVLACLSACMKGIKAETPSVICCSGTFNSLQTCKKEEVDFYDFFKSGCQNAYAFPYDYGPPTVDFTCAKSLASGYIIEFCPGGTGSRSPITTSSSSSPKDQVGKSTDVETKKKGSEPTNSAKEESLSPSDSAPTARSSGAERSEANHDELTAATTTSTIRDSTSDKVTPTTPPRDEAPTPMPSSKEDVEESTANVTTEGTEAETKDDEFLGLEPQILALIAGAAVLGLGLLVGFCVWCTRRAHALPSQNQSDSTTPNAPMASLRSVSSTRRRWHQLSDSQSEDSASEMDSTDNEDLGQPMMSSRRNRHYRQ